LTLRISSSPFGDQYGWPPACGTRLSLANIAPRQFH
jgi:hypothetical protein